MDTVIYTIGYHLIDDRYPDLPCQDTLTIYCHRFPSLSFDTFPSADDIIKHAYRTFPSTSLETFFDDFIVESIRVFPIDHLDTIPVLRFRAVRKSIEWHPFGDTYHIFIDESNKITRVSIEYNRAYDNDTSTLTFSEPLPLEIGGFGTVIRLNSFIPILRIQSIPMRITGNMLDNAFTCSDSLIDISGLANWDVSGATSMESTFRFCKRLTDLSPIAEWDTSNVTIMDEMFDHCDSLSSTSYLSKWNVSRVTSMICMFSCSSIVDLDGVADWDVSNVTNMHAMFGKTEVRNIDALAKWDTSKVTNMDEMFMGSKKLADISGVLRWDVRKVRSVQGMFSRCAMESLDALREWKPISMMCLIEMFEGCVKLSDISALSEWSPTTSFHNLHGMFKGCVKICDATPLSKWDVSNVVNVTDMLDECDLYKDDLFALLDNWDLYSIDRGWRTIATFRDRKRTCC